MPRTPDRSSQGTPEPLVALCPLPPVSADEAALCIVCYDAPCGTVLRPCGHDHFCITCARQFRTCPLCRVPLIPMDDDGRVVPGAVARPSLLSADETCSVAWVAGFVYGIIFLGGYIENCHRVPGTDETDGCVECFSGGYGTAGGRTDCRNESYLQAGSGCYEKLEDIPPVQTGAALGGMTYLVLIILTQVLGMACEISLIRRLMRRNLMPRKELLILGTALLIEVSRMLLVDIFVLWLGVLFGTAVQRLSRASPVPRGGCWSLCVLYYMMILEMTVFY